jgi:transposase InsO family protein
MFRSGVPAGFSKWRPPPTTTSLVGTTGIEARIKDVCTTCVRYGYRRVHMMLRREGWIVNAKKAFRICNELGLQLRNKTPRQRVKAKLRDDRQSATQPNETWAMDFVYDQLATGRKQLQSAQGIAIYWHQCLLGFAIIK